MRLNEYQVSWKNQIRSLHYGSLSVYAFDIKRAVGIALTKITGLMQHENEKDIIITKVEIKDYNE